MAGSPHSGRQYWFGHFIADEDDHRLYHRRRPLGALPSVFAIGGGHGREYDDEQDR
jgi:hypothetical protein